jgi:hypothetical protein
MDQEQVTLPKGAWATLGRLIGGVNLGVTTDQAAEIAALMRSAKVEPVVQSEGASDTTPMENNPEGC